VRGTEYPVEHRLLDRRTGELPTDIPAAVDHLVEVWDPRRAETTAVAEAFAI
jgi:hypothetical protein